VKVDKEKFGPFFQLDSSQEVKLHPSSVMFGYKPELVIFCTLMATQKSYIRDLSLVDPVICRHFWFSFNLAQSKLWHHGQTLHLILSKAAVPNLEKSQGLCGIQVLGNIKQCLLYAFVDTRAQKGWEPLSYIILDYMYSRVYCLEQCFPTFLFAAPLLEIKMFAARHPGWEPLSQENLKSYLPNPSAY